MVEADRQPSPTPSDGCISLGSEYVCGHDGFPEEQCPEDQYVTFGFVSGLRASMLNTGLRRNTSSNSPQYELMLPDRASSELSRDSPRAGFSCYNSPTHGDTLLDDTGHALETNGIDSSYVPGRLNPYFFCVTPHMLQEFIEQQTYLAEKILQKVYILAFVCQYL